MFDDPSGGIAGRFTRVEPRRRARAFVLGLLADLPCMNCRASPSTLGTWPPSGGRWGQRRGHGRSKQLSSAGESNVKSISRGLEAVPALGDHLEGHSEGQNGARGSPPGLATASVSGLSARARGLFPGRGCLRPAAGSSAACHPGYRCRRRFVRRPGAARPSALTD